MYKRYLPAMLLALAGIILLALAACTTSEAETEEPPPDEDTEEVSPTEPAEEPDEESVDEVVEEELFGDPIRGGLLYDKWWTPLGLDEPEDDHPLWATQDSNTRSGDDTWRCKECHGWDYLGADGAYGSGSHFTGFLGVFQFAGGSATDALAALQGGTNPDHDFSTVMDEQALIDIALFLTEEAYDFSTLVGEDKMALSDDMATGEELFLDCTECHGVEGLAINFSDTVSDPEYLPGLALGNPWEALHKMRFGQPGIPDMLSAIDVGWTPEEQAAVLAYMQALPESDPVTEGGILYDKWWVGLGLDTPEGDHPLWATQETNERSGSDTWRCKECHGWDYLGADGAYGSGSHFTGFTGVLDAASMSADELLGWLDGTSNPDHDFSAYMDEAAMGMMVAFLQDGVFDTSEYINDDKTANGDPAVGQSLYDQACARCHGEDGQQINFGDEDEPEYVAEIANDNPWEFMHKAGNGQPGTSMTIGRNMGWSWEDIANLLAYAQTLPGAGE